MSNGSANSSDYGVSDLGNEDDFDYYMPPTDVTVSVVTLTILVVLVGILGNIFVLIIIGYQKSMQSSVNRCLFILAVADLIILVFLPIQPLYEQFAEDFSSIGEHMCYFLNFYDRGAVVCSVLLFMYLTVDRYLALCYPLKFRHFWLRRHTYLVIIIVWLIAGAMSVPYLYIGKYGPWVENNITYHYCYLDFSEGWTVWYETATLFVVFFVPIPFVAYLYARMISTIWGSVNTSGPHNSSTQRARKQVIIMLMLNIIVFLICQAPFNLILIFDFHFPSVFSFSVWDKKAFALTWSFRILIYVNSAANPYIYFLVSSNFREAFKKTFLCKKKKSFSQSTGNIYTVSRSGSQTVNTSAPE